MLHHNPFPVRQPMPDRRCRCRGPLSLYIPPGGHAHPCPVHPERVAHNNWYLRC